MKKQSAIDWLVEQMFGEHTRAWQKQIDQAKAMEKEQMIEAYKSGEENAEYYISKCAEQYYNETYNTDTP